MRFQTLDQWLVWQQRLHFTEIDLGLERVSVVAQRLDLTKIASKVITVAGTNGKGSTVAFYNAALQALGYTTGCYTSPHLLRYNERIQINSEELSDSKIIEAFAAIDEARQDISLTYFEMGTLAAFYCFKQAKVDCAILEVGLGGRLDAVNLVDANLVHFTQIGIDHTAWLGDTREKIAIEKAGVLRRDCLTVCNDPEPPSTLINAIEEHTHQAVYFNQQYSINENELIFIDNDMRFDLSHLKMLGDHQQRNAAGVLAGLKLLDLIDKRNQLLIQRAINETQVKGRFEKVFEDDHYQFYIDVGHNEDAAKQIANNLKQLKSHHQQDNIVVILGMLQDKSVQDFVEILNPLVSQFLTVTLEGERGLSADDLIQRANLNHKMTAMTDMSAAILKAKNYCLNSKQSMNLNHDKGIILVTGSFYTVESFLTSKF